MPVRTAAIAPLSPAPLSPCIRNCTLDDEQICIGCGRHVDEIIAWTAMSIDHQRIVLERSAQRRAQLNAIKPK